MFNVAFYASRLSLVNTQNCQTFV